MLERSCIDFLDELGSSAPVPGGGSAAALVAAVGMALGTMVGELTTGKKTYAQYEEEIQALIGRSRALTQELKAAVYRDIEAFEPLSMAYRMPGKTDEEKAAKEKALQESLTPAAQAPLMLAETCLEAIKLLDRYSEIGSRLAVSDAGTGSVMCLSALKSAALNVLINTGMMKDTDLKANLEQRLAAAVSEGERLSAITYDRVLKAVSK